SARRRFLASIPAEASDAILIEVAQPVVLAADSLTSKRSSAIGAMSVASEIYYNTVMNCTAGFNAQRSNNVQGVFDGQRYLITAGHCTSVFADYDGLHSSIPMPRAPTARWWAQNFGKLSISRGGWAPAAPRMPSATPTAPME
ncbi:MAG TPA: hypothetical protein VJ867_15990, partial [Gemmatimonadaceae bacterium]|nr:hypothetical protein [Gemmatimonadaceae bacterium]